MYLEWSIASVFDSSETLYLQAGALHTGHFRYPYTEFCPDFSYTVLSPNPGDKTIFYSGSLREYINDGHSPYLVFPQAQ